ncbi:MAG: SLC13 family permease [Bacteroidales bacterium]|nr:SLC13 family permease [Bacteroidales bacterium]
MNVTFIILIITMIFFVWGKMRSDLVALCSLLAFVLTNVLTQGEALAGFSNSVVLMMIGLFIVGGAIFRTGLAKMISSRILRLAGTNENRLFILVVLVTGILGAFVSNTGTVAVMLPIVMSMTASANINERRYLMPLAFASSMGLFTLISTPPNLVIQETITGAGYQPLSFFSFAPIGAICLIVGIIILFFLSKKLVVKETPSVKVKSKGKTLTELVKEYDLVNQFFKVYVLERSPLIGKTLAESRIGTIYGVNIMRMGYVDKFSKLRKRIKEDAAAANSVILAENILFCHGKREDIKRFADENALIFRENSHSIPSSPQESGIAEAYILPNSTLINHTIAEIKFRDEYNVNVLAIQRNQEYRLNNIRDTKLRSGDALLLQGTWQNLASLDVYQSDLVLVGQPLKEAAKVTLDKKAPIAAGIMIAMILVMAFDLIPAVIAVLLASVLMIITGCLRNMKEAYEVINWESVVLIAAMLPMATAFEKTGAVAMISDGLVHYLGNYGPYILLAGVYLGTSFLTMFISNTATAVLFAPIALQSAIGLGVSPYPFLFAVAVGASMCFASPFSTAPNALVMSAGRYTFMDFIKVGLPLQIIMGVIMTLILPLIFPF